MRAASVYPFPRRSRIPITETRSPTMVQKPQFPIPFPSPSCGTPAASGTLACLCRPRAIKKHPPEGGCTRLHTNGRPQARERRPAPTHAPRAHATSRAHPGGLHAPGRPARRRWPQRRYTSPIPRRFMVSGKQAVLLAPGSSRPGPSHRTVAAVALFRVAPRGQWRDRVGLAPNFSIKLRRAPVFRRYEVVMPSYHVRALLSMRIADDERFFRFALI